MNFVQVKDILRLIHAASRRLVGVYEGRWAEVSDPAIRWCLKRAIAHERSAQASIERYLEQAPEHVLGGWFQSVGVWRLDEVMAEVTQAPLRTSAEAAALVVRCHEAFIETYRHLCAQAFSRDVGRVLGGLLGARQERSRRHAWQSLRTLI